MPGIYGLSCQKCDYAVKGVMSVTTVVMGDGSETACPHPLERMIAEKVTGKRWWELARSNRIVYRHALVCLACGKLDYYGPRDLSADARAGGFIASIVHQPGQSEAAAYSCKSCDERQLYPLCGETGCLRGLLELVGLFRERVVCPKCREGLLQFEMVAIT